MQLGAFPDDVDFSKFEKFLEGGLFYFHKGMKHFVPSSACVVLQTYGVATVAGDVVPSVAVVAPVATGPLVILNTVDVPLSTILFAESPKMQPLIMFPVPDTMYRFLPSVDPFPTQFKSIFPLPVSLKHSKPVPTIALTQFCNRLLFPTISNFPDEFRIVQFFNKFPSPVIENQPPAVLQFSKTQF